MKDWLLIIWQEAGVIVIVLICLLLSLIIPESGLFGSQNKVIINICANGSELCPF